MEAFIDCEFVMITRGRKRIPSKSFPANIIHMIHTSLTVTVTVITKSRGECTYLPWYRMGLSNGHHTSRPARLNSPLGVKVIFLLVRSMVTTGV